MPILAQGFLCSFFSPPSSPSLGLKPTWPWWSTGSSVAAAYRPLLGRVGPFLSLGEPGSPVYPYGQEEGGFGVVGKGGGDGSTSRPGRTRVHRNDRRDLGRPVGPVVWIDRHLRPPARCASPGLQKGGFIFEPCGTKSVTCRAKEE